MLLGIKNLLEPFAVLRHVPFITRVLFVSIIQNKNKKKYINKMKKSYTIEILFDKKDELTSIDMFLYTIIHNIKIIFKMVDN